METRYFNPLTESSDVFAHRAIRFTLSHWHNNGSKIRRMNQPGAVPVLNIGEAKVMVNDVSATNEPFMRIIAEHPLQINEALSELKKSVYYPGFMEFENGK